MTDCGRYHTISFCVDDAFDGVEDVFAEINDEYGMSKSAIFRTILHEFTGVPQTDMVQHNKQLARINRIITERQEKQ
jgi:hypothetical protein